MSSCSVQDGVVVAIAVPVEVHDSAEHIGVETRRSRTSYLGGESLRGSPDTLAVFAATHGTHFNVVCCFSGQSGKRVGGACNIDEVHFIVVNADLPSCGSAVFRPIQNCAVCAYFRCNEIRGLRASGRCPRSIVDGNLGEELVSINIIATIVAQIAT